MIAHPLDFIIGQTCQSGALSGDANFLYEINQIFTIEIQFFCERVNACHWVLILSNCLETTSPWLHSLRFRGGLPTVFFESHKRFLHQPGRESFPPLSDPPRGCAGEEDAGFKRFLANEASTDFIAIRGKPCPYEP